MADTIAVAEWAPASTPCVNRGNGTDCILIDYPDRPFEIDVPSSYDPGTPVPLLVVLHGGGGNSAHARSSACRNGDLSADNCFAALGDREGFIIVYPNGSGLTRLPDVRTWNAGGGDADHACVSGRACERNIDDVAYMDALLDELAKQYNIDHRRTYVTGFSNGAAMAHRLGCERAERFAAIAPVSGANQFASSAPCEPTRPVPVIQIHGTEDPCWTYQESNRSCLDPDPRPKVGVAESTLGWVDSNGCDRPAEETQLPDTADDGMTTIISIWTGCDSAVEVQLLTVQGGGHVFPSGSPGRSRIVGTGTADFDSSYIWSFLTRFSLDS